MRVLVYEPVYWAGHNLAYVNYLVRTLSELGVKPLVVTCTGGRTSAQYREHLQGFDCLFDLHEVVPPPAFGDDWGRHFCEWLLASVERLRADYVLVPSSDALSAYAGSRALRRLWRDKLRHVVVAANVLSGFHPRRLPLRNTPHSIRTSIYCAAAPWDILFSINPFLGILQWPLRSMHRALPRLLPDPVELLVNKDQSAARARLGLPDDAPIVGCAGHFASSDRKNPAALVDGFARSRWSRRGYLFLAGELPEAFRDTVIEPSGLSDRILVFDRYISSEHLQLAIAAMDLVCLPYRDFFQPSGILLNAAAVGRPVLTSNTGWFEQLVPFLQLGWTRDLRDGARIAAALDEHLDSERTLKPQEAWRRFVAYSSWRNFGASFCADVARRLGRSLPHNPIEWRWVTAAAQVGA